MKDLFIILILTSSLFSLACSKGVVKPKEIAIPKQKVQLTIATFNVLSRDKDESNARDFGGEIRFWKNRKQVVANTINKNKFSVFGAQELNFPDMKTELAELIPKYASTSTLKEDPIYWLKEDYTLIDEGEFLANNGPYSLKENPSPYWGKFVIWVKLKENRSGKEFFVFNGHPVYNTDKAPYRSAFARELVRQERIINSEGLPVFFTGDLNAYDERGTDDESAFYNEIYGDAGFDNALKIARVKTNEEYGTWAGFNRPGNYAWLDRIYISGKNSADVIVHGYEAIIDFDPNKPGYRVEPVPSDHFPVMVRVELEYK